MPLYEVSWILRTLTKAENKIVLKRAISAILEEGAILRKIESLGTKQLPYKMSKDEVRYRQGSYFICQFDSHTGLIDDLKNLYRRDIDIIKAHIVHVVSPEPLTCTLAEELLPPAYRPEVLKMIEEGKKKAPKKLFSMNVDIYPFQ